jgi:AGZA family xanthine/uracil permease-like MFS transporter
MMRQVVNINWRYIGDAVPAFVTVMFIPFGYSAAYGLIAGLMTYTALNGLIYLTKIVSRGYIVPDDEDHREYWTSEFSLQCTSPLKFGTKMTAVKPMGKVPWFISASQQVAAHFGHGSESKQDTTSMRSSDSQERFRSGSKASNQELDTVVVIPNPRDEKVLRKI